MMSEAKISATWADAAIQIAESQPMMPVSPGLAIGGRLALCSAACIAFAGLKLESRGEEIKFTENLLSSNDKRVVEDAYRGLGLSTDLCREHMYMNDLAPPASRVEALRSMLNRSAV